jgi:hypothetical protein
MGNAPEWSVRLEGHPFSSPYQAVVALSRIVLRTDRPVPPSRIQWICNPWRHSNKICSETEDL